MNKHINNRRGIALVLVLVVVAASTTLGIGYALAASVRASSSANMALASRARYLAESGSQHALYMLKHETAMLLASSSAAPLGPFYIDGSSESYKFYAAPGSGAGNVYTIVASGSAGGISQSVSMAAMAMNLYHTFVMAHNPIAYWRLGESSGPTAFDETGAFSGTYTNGVQPDQPGALNAANNTSASFDGFDDFIDLGTMDIITSEVTILAWFKINAWGMADSRIISKAKSDKKDQTYWMLSTVKENENHRLLFRLRIGSKDKDLSSGSSKLTAGQWFFVAAVHDGARMTIYQNGVAVGSVENAGVIATDKHAPVSIGGSPYSATANPLDGLIDEVAIIPKALDAEQIAILYQARLPYLKIISWED